MSPIIRPLRDSDSMQDLISEIEGPSPEMTVFHDESGTYNQDEWVLHGLLWIRRKDVNEFIDQLRKMRGNYEEELHFSDFKKSFERTSGLPQSGVNPSDQTTGQVKTPRKACIL